MDQTYHLWASRYYVRLPGCGIILLALPYLPIQARKVLLAFTRIRQRVSQRTRFSRTFANEMRKHYAFKLDLQSPAYTILTIEQLLLGLEEFIDDPITLSFLSTCIRTAPYMDYTSVVETQEDSIKKEIQAAITEASNACLYWDAIFDQNPRSRRIRLFPNLPFSPDLNQQIHDIFQNTKRTLEGHIFYPQTSDKTIGYEARELSQHQTVSGMDQLYSMHEATSTRDCERFYHLWGVELKGIVEMRSAWKYNVLKPRVYYAQGPDCYAASKYVQEVFNIILDHFEVVHRYNRYEKPDERMTGQKDRLAIYDYTSFTSSLEQVKAFTRELALFYSGIMVVIVDTFQGPVTADLGDLIWKYNDVCNEQAEFDVTRLLHLEDVLHLCNTTGMLGVPGNISSCTLLHGIHMIMALGGLSRGRCVGDDAMAILKGGTDSDTWKTFIEGVNNLGDIAREKFEYWDYEDDPDTTGGAYCKRPISRLENSILQGLALVWPGIHDLLPLRDAFHKHEPKTPKTITKTFIAQWSRLLTRMETYMIEPTQSARIVLKTFQDWAYRQRDLGLGGVRFIPTLSCPMLCPKKLQLDEFGIGWKQLTIDFMRQTEELVEFPCRAGVTSEPSFMEGEVFEHPGSRLLGLLEMLGYVQKIPQKELIDIRSITSYEYLSELITLAYPIRYEWTVLYDCPVWVKVVNSLELMSPHERISNLNSGWF